MKELCVVFDQFLNFDDYFSGVCRSTHFHLRNIGRIRHLLSYDPNDSDSDPTVVDRPTGIEHTHLEYHCLLEGYGWRSVQHAS